MQIHGLHKNVYKLYAYARTQECLETYRTTYQARVNAWSSLKKEGVSDRVAKTFVGCSRSSYYRSKQVLKLLDRGIPPPSKRPRKVNKPRWGDSKPKG